MRNNENFRLKVKHGTIQKSDVSRITACEMKFMHRTAGYTKWYLKRNEEVLKELKVEPILDYICRYQNNW
jgi:hypothetical protein